MANLKGIAMFSKFSNFLKTVVTFIFALSLGFAGLVHAQTVAPAHVAPPPPTTGSFVPAMTFQSWNQFAGIATGQNFGGDGRGTVHTIAEGFANMFKDGNVTVNTNPGCTVDCNLTQSRINFNSSMITGAVAQNQGVGNNPVSSQIGGNAMFIGSMRIFNAWVPVPTVPGQ